MHEGVLIKNNNKLISVIIPMYCAEAYIEDAIKCVQAQSYSMWEIIVVDDHSLDSSVETVKRLMQKDARISLIENIKNLGVARARNNGIAHATGRYIAFLDADDVWSDNKLTAQIQLMTEKQAALSYTGYSFVNSKKLAVRSVVSVPAEVTYKYLLKDSVIWTSTVIIDTFKISKRFIKFPKLKTGEDFALWLSLLKISKKAYGLSSSYAFYRRTEGSLSSNKAEMIKSRWYVYRNIENISKVRAIYLMTHYAKSALRRRLK